MRPRRRGAVLAALLVVAVWLSPATGGVIGDIVFTRKGGNGDFPPAYFPHWVHRIKFKCYACHDALFPMKRSDTPLTMEAMSGGKLCGACHTGKVAFALDACNRCHVEH